jgi:hypothetical protein
MTTSATCAAPNNNPVKNRSVLLLSLNPIVCVMESKRKGVTNNISNKNEGCIIPKWKRGKVKYPTNIPVHLAHTGNCLPLKWNDLSGI